MGDLGPTLLADHPAAQDARTPESSNKPGRRADISIDSLPAGIDPVRVENKKIQWPNRIRVRPRLKSGVQMQHPGPGL